MTDDELNLKKNYVYNLLLTIILALDKKTYFLIYSLVYFLLSAMPPHTDHLKYPICEIKITIDTKYFKNEK
jgi:uncharacterized membrane protein